MKEISFSDGDGSIKKFNLEQGSKWSDVQIDNEHLKSIFDNLDDGDGIISETEMDTLIRLIKENANNKGVLNNDELIKLSNKSKENWNKCKEKIDVAVQLYNAINFEEAQKNNIDKLEKQKDEIIVNTWFSYGNNSGNTRMPDVNNFVNTWLSYGNNSGNTQIPDDNKIIGQDSYVKQENSYIPEISVNKIKELWDELDEIKKRSTNVDKDKIKEQMDKMSKNNVWSILKAYEDRTGDKSLINEIMNVSEMDYHQKAEYCKEIFRQLAEFYKPEVDSDDLILRFDDEIDFLNSSNKDEFNTEYLDSFVSKLMNRYYRNNPEVIQPNGELDVAFKQGRTGDCWLISAIIALNNSPKGREILNDSIKVNDDESVSVNLKGVGKTYTFTKKEIEANNDFSNGDLDIRAIEMAMDKYFYNERGLTNVSGNRHIDLDGNFSDTAYNILVGKTSGTLKKLSSEKMKEEINKFNDENYVATVSSKNPDGAQAINLNDGSSVKLIDNHAYSVIKADDDFVYLINPWDSATEIKVDKDTFSSFFCYCRSINLNAT